MSSFIQSPFLASNLGSASLNQVVSELLNDQRESDETTFSSKKIDELLNLKGDLINGKIPSTQLPALIIGDIRTVTTISNRDALTPASGDICKVIDAGKTFIYDSSNWVQLTDDVLEIGDIVSLQSVLDGKEPIFTKNSGFNKNFGIISGSIAEGLVTQNALNGKASTIHSHVASDITDFNTVADTRASIRFNVEFPAKTTTDLQEGNKLYYTEGRVSANLNVVAGTNHIGRSDNPHSTTKSQIGLGNADNTSDALKPISNAAQIVLDQKAVIDDSVSVSNKTYSSSKINTLVETIISGLKFIGTWNANSNQPVLTDTTGVVGTYYIVNTNGSSNLNGINEWLVGDWIIRASGSPNQWQKLDQTNSVLTVNNQIGQVILSTNEIGENTNLYFTDTRVNNNPTVVNNTAHRGRIDNPHSTTKSQIGLSNADNTSDLSKPISTLTQNALNGKAALSHTHSQSDIINLVSDLATKCVIDNANSTTTTTYSSSAINSLLLNKKIGLRFIDNWNASTNSPLLSDNAGTAGNYYVVSTGGSTLLGGITDWKFGDWIIRNDNYLTGFNYWTKLDQSNTITSVNGLIGDVVLNKSNVGLNNVDNTSDLNKPISTLTSNSISTKEPNISTSGALPSQFLNSSKTYSYPDKLWVNDSFISVVDGSVGAIKMVVDNKNIVNVDATGITLPTGNIRMGDPVYTQISPNPMNGPTTNGVIASSSSNYDANSVAWKAFDNDQILTEWHTSVTPVRYLESSTDPTLSGTCILPALSTTVLTNNTIYAGEWIQLQYPNPVKINVIKLFPRNQPFITRSDQSPRDFGFFTSNTGLDGSWVQVFNVLNNFWDFATYIPKEFGFQATTALYWRIAINRVGDGVQQNIAETICALPNIIMSYKTNSLTSYDTVQDQITVDKGLILNGSMVVKGTDIINSIATKEPIFTKNTAFNKSFGFASLQVPDGLLTQNALNLKQDKTADISTKKITVTSGYDYMTGLSTSNSSNGMVSSSSSGTESWKCFDGNNNTVYTSDVKYKSGTGSNDPTSGTALAGSGITNSYSGEWIQIKYASSLIINTFKILPNQGAGVSYLDTSPKDFAIFTSDTGLDGSWVSVFSILNYTGWNTQFSEFSFPAKQAVYWRLSVNKIGNGNNDTRAETQLIIAAIEMWKIDAGDITAQILNINNTLQVGGVSTFQNDVVIGGSLTVNGFNTIINSTTVSIDDALFRLADGNTSNLSDIGLYGLSNGNLYSGLVRKATDKKWYLFTDHLTEPIYGANYSTNLGAMNLNTLNCNSILTPNNDIALSVGYDKLTSQYPIFAKQFYVQSIATVSPIAMPTSNNTYFLMKNISILYTSGAVSKATMSYNGDNGWGLKVTDWVFDKQVVKLTLHVNAVLSAAGSVYFSLITYTQAKITGGASIPENWTELAIYKVTYPSATVYVPFTFDVFVPLDIYQTYSIGCYCGTSGLSLTLQTASMVMTLA
jgi:hypothetical protein